MAVWYAVGLVSRSEVGGARKGGVAWQFASKAISPHRRRGGMCGDEKTGKILNEKNR